QNCTNVLLKLDQPPPFATTAYFLFKTDEIQTFDLADLVVNQTAISPCVTEGDLEGAGTSKDSLADSSYELLNCSTSVETATLRAADTQSYSHKKLRPRVKPFNNAGIVPQQCLITEHLKLFQHSDNLTAFKHCVNV